MQFLNVFADTEILFIREIMVWMGSFIEWIDFYLLFIVNLLSAMVLRFFEKFLFYDEALLLQKLAVVNKKLARKVDIPEMLVGSVI